MPSARRSSTASAPTSKLAASTPTSSPSASTASTPPAGATRWAPSSRTCPAPAPTPARVPRSRAARGERDLGARLGGYVAVSVLLVAIWALTGAGAFWPVWFIGFGLFGVVGGGGYGMCGARRHGYRHAGVPARPGPPTIGG